MLLVIATCHLTSTYFCGILKKSSFAEPYIVCVTFTSGGGMLKERERENDRFWWILFLLCDTISMYLTRCLCDCGFGLFLQSLPIANIRNTHTHWATFSPKSTLWTEFWEEIILILLNWLSFAVDFQGKKCNLW